MRTRGKLFSRQHDLIWAELSALFRLALSCLLVFLLTGCKATQTVPKVSVIAEPPIKSVALSVRSSPKTWSLRLTRL